MTPKLYHERVYLPPDLEYPDGSTSIVLSYTQHAKQAAKNDRFGNLTKFLPSELYPNDWKLIEVQALGYDILSLLYTRTIYGKGLKLALAVSPTGTVKTVWANGAYFNFDRLDTSRYVKPPKSPVEGWG